jgi:cytochrome c oxidase assembly factor CtaG
VLDMVWPGSIVVWGVALLLGGLYVRGARRLRRSGFAGATGVRTLLFLLAAAFISSAFAWPLLPLSQHHLLARMGQKVAICLVGVPLLWLSLPVHVLAAGLPGPLRRWVAGLCFRHRRWTPAVRAVTGPFAAWFLYIAAFLIWHDPGFADWAMQGMGRQLGALSVLLIAALLFWQQVTLGGPRRYATAGTGARFGMLLGAEAPNVVAGITIAFGSTPLYAFYSDAATLSAAQVVSEQSLSGALTWVFGSLVYIGAIVAVAGQVFHAEGVVQPGELQGWDADERFIAPGLEERVREEGYRAHDWRK